MNPQSHPVTPPLSRRNFLRAAGVCIALPGMESLARGASLSTPPVAPLRMAFMSIPNGVQQARWFPTADGTDFPLSPTLQPLESVKKHVQLVCGLKHVHATAGPDGAGDHARANATFLTGARARKTAGKDIHVGVSIDQVAAKALQGTTRFPSLELSCDAVRNAGSCDSGYACAYQYNLSWSTPTTPVTPEPNPRLVFERLFGAGDPEERRRNYLQRLGAQRSVLDFVLDDARIAARRLSGADRRKLDEYLTSVRAVEQRVAMAEQGGDVPLTESPAPNGIPRDFGQHMTAMYDLLTLAFQTDSTRIATLLLSYDGSNRSFPQIGIAEGHHHLTHHQRQEELAAKVAAIDHYYMQYFAAFLEKIAAIEDIDGRPLIENTMIAYGGAIADGNRHTHHNLPLVLAGSAGGRFTTGRILTVDEQPMSNLFVTMLNTMGVPTESFGDSDGSIELAG